MNKDKLNALLDSIYELEGLVHLALTREDEPKSLPELIVRKAEELPGLVAETVKYKDSASDSFTPSTEADMLGLCIDPVSDETYIEDNYPIQETVSNTFSEYGFDKQNSILQDEERYSHTGQKNPEYITSSQETEIIRTPNVQKPKVFEPRADLEARLVKESSALKPEPRRSMPVQPVTGKVAAPESMGDQNFTKKTDTTPNQIEPRGRLVFTINDRYRFKRDLFNSSDADFNTSLALVASMDSYEEAEAYFLGDLQWQPQREEVIDFLEILKNYFK